MKPSFQKSILLIYIITFVVSIIGATYAYFTVIKVNTTSPEIDTTAAVTEVMLFSIDDTLNVNGSQYNMNQGMDSVVASTDATTYLRFDAGTRVVTHLYDLLLVVDDNNFEYTTDDEKPEIVLSVKNPDGSVVTSITGLEYIEDKAGFDITTANGEYYIAKEYVIATDSEVSQVWNVSITLVNLDTDQQINAEKELNGRLILQRSENDFR